MSNYFEGGDSLSPSFCEAVGSTQPLLIGTFEADPLIEQWNGSVWTMASVPSIGMGDYLYGVSCVTVDSCAAVGGYYTTTGNYNDFDNDALAWDGTSWTRATVPNAAESGSALNAVSCLSGLSCVAAGDTSTPSPKTTAPWWRRLRSPEAAIALSPLMVGSLASAPPSTARWAANL